MGKVAAMVCPRCGWYGYPVKRNPGSFWVLLFLFLLFLLPGIIYAVWMLVSDYVACGSCGAKELVEPGSPVGLELLHRHHPELFKAQGA